jgi:non-homologous end joining protein Ku
MPYSVKALEKTGLAAIGKVTMSTKERVVLIHYYQNAIVATTLRYRDEVKDPSHFAELKDLLEAGDEELALITSKMKGEVAQVRRSQRSLRPRA